mmetsp:Transcript_9384/g.16935  ORF Transcript_9384/g.16935 Transcript_9384/m.16935 type:complete len:182 (-) Transcript_9384:1165-1710(-)
MLFLFVCLILVLFIPFVCTLDVTSVSVLNQIPRSSIIVTIEWNTSTIETIQATRLNPCTNITFPPLYSSSTTQLQQQSKTTNPILNQMYTFPKSTSKVLVNHAKFNDIHWIYISSICIIESQLPSRRCISPFNLNSTSISNHQLFLIINTITSNESNTPLQLDLQTVTFSEWKNFSNCTKN